MVGIPESERQQLAHAADAMVSSGDPEYLNGRHPLEVLFEAQTYVHQVAGVLAAERREHPGDDLFTSLVNAEVDGDRLADADVAAFFVLLTVAGNDTTRQTTSHALKALTDYPDQRAWLLEDFDNRIGGAVEEFIRWASPVMTFRRTAAKDVEIGGQAISAGEKVVMFYSSGNFDTDVFAHPERLDLSRNPNPHVGFGGGGVHFCLGANLARAQLRAIFGELLHQLPDIQAGDPAYRGRQLHPRHPQHALHVLVHGRRGELLGQQCQQLRAAAVDLDAGQLVAAGRAAVDDGDRHAQGRGVPHEAVTGEHRQRRTGDQQRLSVFDQRK